MSHVRIYHPVTSEPFDVPETRATELRLQDGWLSHPIEPDTAPAVQTVQKPQPKGQRRYSKDAQPFEDAACKLPEASEKN